MVDCFGAIASIFWTGFGLLIDHSVEKTIGRRIFDRKTPQKIIENLKKNWKNHVFVSEKNSVEYSRFLTT